MSLQLTLVKFFVFIVLFFGPDDGLVFLVLFILTLVVPNLLPMSNDAAKKTMATNWFCLLKIIECLQYLAPQAMLMQGDTDEESNFIQLLKLRGKDQPVLLKWLERKDDKYTSHEIQNEIISIMANNVIRDLIADIRGGFFAIIVDEYTDISNKEQLTICIRWIDKSLEVHEDFLGFFNIPDTGAETIVSVIKAEIARIIRQSCVILKQITKTMLMLEP